MRAIKFRSYLDLIMKKLLGFVNMQTITYWLAAIVTGIVASLFAKLFSYSESLALSLARGPQKYWLFATLPLGLILSWLTVRLFSPLASGSGIPQVMLAADLAESLHENLSSQGVLRRLLGPRVLISKIVSTLFAALGGASIGREGPTIQIAASIFYSLKSRFSKLGGNPISPATWITTGGGAGLAAAFNTPIGGIVYVLEELAPSHFQKIKTSLLSSVIIAGYTAQMIGGNYLYFGVPKLADQTLLTILGAILVGAAAGISGGFFGRLLLYSSQLRSKIKSTKTSILVIFLIGFSLAAVAIFVDESSIGGGREVVVSYLFGGHEHHDYKTPIIRFLSPIASFSVGGAGGIFAPSLAAGASIGDMIGHLLNTSTPNLFVLFGMIGFLSGFTQAPFTSFIVVLEMTDRHSALLPMMLASLAALTVSKIYFNQPFYQIIKQRLSQSLRVS